MQMLFTIVVPNTEDGDFYSLQYMYLGSCKTECLDTRKRIYRKRLLWIKQDFSV